MRLQPNRTGLLVGTLGLAIGVLSMGCSKAPPDEGANARVQRTENLRGIRYGEVFLITGNPLTHNLEASVYNTTGLNNQDDPRDTCPTALWARVDAEAVKKQYNVLGVFKNGPRVWTIDWGGLPVGTERDFNGLKTRWVATLKLPKDVDLNKKGSTAYHSTTVARKSQMGFDKGKPIFILDDPEGNPWVMHAYSLIVDPNLKYDSLKDLGSRLKLPPGWKFRVKILDQDLTIRAVDGIAHILQDDLQNTYDLCSGGAASFMP